MPVFLLVEDDLDDPRLLRRALEPRVRMDVIDDGRRALEYLERESPFLVLSDIHLPAASGWEILERVRARSERVPVFLWTSLPTPEGARRAVAAGADRYLGKPKDLEGYRRIAALIESCLGD